MSASNNALRILNKAERRYGKQRSYTILKQKREKKRKLTLYCRDDIGIVCGQLRLFTVILLHGMGFQKSNINQ